MADDAPEGQESGCEAMLLFWYVGEGDEVAEGDDLAEIETAKAVIVVRAPTSGTVTRILVPEGEAVHPGQTLAVISQQGG